MEHAEGVFSNKGWRSAIPATDLAVYEAAGYGRRLEPGRHPALIVVDVTYGFVGRERAPILESIRTYPNSCGAAGWDAVGPIARVIAATRQKGAPIYFTAGLDEQFAPHAGRWRDKHPRTLDQPGDAHQLLPDLGISDSDVLIRKTKPSAFHGTPLIGSLIDSGVDTLIVTGCTTSGCIRATVVDAFSYGLRTIVVEDGVFDRGQLPHAVNLFDMEQKYATVMPSEDVISYLREVGNA